MARDDREDRGGEDVTPEPGRHRARPGVGRAALRGLSALALVLIGVAGGVVWSERRAWRSAPVAGSAERVAGGERTGRAAPALPPSRPADGAEKAAEPVEVSLTPEAVERAGIRTATARSGTSAATLTVPGTVTSNAYRDTKVHALVGGVVRRVGAELGQPVTRGQDLGVIFSNELAEAQMKYLSMRATLGADQQKLARTEQLAAIGAASRQELEEVTATHHAHETELAAARQRLLLLGLTGEQVGALREASHVVSEVVVTAPSDGVVILRSVNPGQVVAAGQELFAVADLSTVWVIGDLYERDVAGVRVGAEATVGVPGAPGEALRGRVAYIDPRVDAATRTAKARVEVPNRGDRLRLGMYVSVSVQAAAGEHRTLVPRAAVQMLGDRAVVYVPVPDGAGRFAERSVRLGVSSGDLVQIVEGVRPGERVVTEGSFLLRAEAARTRPGG